MSKWNLDDGYSAYSDNDNLLTNHERVNPLRMSGVGYYHRFRLMLHSLQNDEVFNCPKIDIGNGSFMVRN